MCIPQDTTDTTMQVHPLLCILCCVAHPVFCIVCCVVLVDPSIATPVTMDIANAQVRSTREMLRDLATRLDGEHAAQMHFTDERQRLLTRVGALKEERRAIEQKRAQQVLVGERIKELTARSLKLLDDIARVHTSPHFRTHLLLLVTALA